MQYQRYKTGKDVAFFHLFNASKTSVGQNTTPHRLNDESNIRAYHVAWLALYSFDVGAIRRSGNVLLRFTAACRWILLSCGAGKICAKNGCVACISMESCEGVIQSEDCGTVSTIKHIS